MLSFLEDRNSFGFTELVGAIPVWHPGRIKLDFFGHPVTPGEHTGIAPTALADHVIPFDSAQGRKCSLHLNIFMISGYNILNNSCQT